MDIRKIFVFQQALNIKSGAKRKIRGSQGEKLAKRGIGTTEVAQKVQEKFRDIACKIFTHWRQAAKIYVATSHSVVRQKTVEIS